MVNNEENILELKYGNLLKIFSSFRYLFLISSLSLIITFIYFYNQHNKPNKYELKVQLTSLNELDFFEFKEFQYDMSKLYSNMENLIGLKNSSFAFEFRKESLFDIYFSETFNKKNITEAANNAVSNSNDIDYLTSIDPIVEIETIGSVVDTYNVLKISIITDRPKITKKFLENYAFYLNNQSRNQFIKFIDKIIINYEKFFVNQLNNLLNKKIILTKELNVIAKTEGFDDYKDLINKIDKLEEVSFILDNNNINFGESNLENNYIKFNIGNLKPQIGLLLYKFSNLNRIDDQIESLNIYYESSKIITSNMRNAFLTNIEFLSNTENAYVSSRIVPKKYILNSILIFMSTFLTITLILFLFLKVKENKINAK